MKYRTYKIQPLNPSDMERFFATIEPVLILVFRLHDWVCGFLVRRVMSVKRALLVIAHLTLFGFLFPEIRRDFGSVAQYTLLFLLFLSPLSRIFRMRLLLLLMGFRRQFGIFMAYCATVHGVGFLLDPLWFDVVIRSHLPGNVLGIEITYLFGITAYALTLPLLFTSNNLANRILGGKNWKRLHRIVYLVLVLVLIHVAFVKRGGIAPGEILQAFFWLFLYILAKLLVWKNFLPPLVRSIDMVAQRYATFRAVPTPLSRVPQEQNGLNGE